MKILHIAFSGLGGHGNVFFSMADADKEKQHQLEVIFYGNEELREGYKQMANQRGIPWHFIKKNSRFDFQASRQIRKIIQSSSPQIIFLHSSSYIFAVKRAMLLMKPEIKLVVRESHANHLKTGLNWLGLCMALIWANKVVFLSTEYRDAIKKKLPLFFSEKHTAVIPNGIDLDLFKPAAKTGYSSINIGMQSRLSDNKDHQTLILAFAQLAKASFDKPVKLFIAGDGACRAQLEKLSVELGVGQAVEFMGMLEEAALPAFINSLDIYVHATFGETMSTAIMQVMACGKTIIASDVLGVNNMIRHYENGLLVPVKDAGALSAAMTALIKDSSLADTLANNAYKFAKENYSNKKMLEGYNKIFTT